MATTLKLRRGTTAAHATFTGAVGEVTVDTDKDVVVVHDGATAGGFPLLGATTPQVLSVNSTSDALRITQTGTGNALLVEDSANPDSTPFVVNADGRVVIGTTTPITAAGVNAGLQTHGAGLSFGSIQASVSAADSTSAGSLYLAKSRGAIGAFDVVSNGDTLGVMNFVGADGSAYIRGASIQAAVDGTPGTNDMPGRLVFSTTADGSSTPTERMRIRNQGSIGIGTTGDASIGLRVGKAVTGATSSVQIQALGAIQSDVTANGSYYTTSASTQATSFTLTNLNHFSAAQSTIGAGSTVTNQYGFHANSTLTGATNNYGFYSNIASGTGRFNFYANGTANNYFAGNVGIGTSSPAVNLNVAKASDGIAARFQRSSGGGLVDIETYNGIGGIGTSDNIPFRLNTNNTERMRIDSSGNVGIGTTTPSSYGNGLVVYNASTGVVRSVGGSITAYMFASSGGGLAAAGTETNHPFALYTNGSERARIDSSGNFLIGKTSTGYTTSGVSLSNSTNQFAWSGNSGSVVASFATPVNQSQIGFYRTDTGGLMGIISNGASNTVAYNTSSDYRLKDNVKPMTGALAKVAALRPVTWTWREDGIAGEGFIAHEVQAIVPDAVTGEKDAVNEDGSIKPQGIDTSFLVATLTAAIKEQQQMIETLQAEVAALKGA